MFALSNAKARSDLSARMSSTPGLLQPVGLKKISRGLMRWGCGACMWRGPIRARRLCASSDDETSGHVKSSGADSARKKKSYYGTLIREPYGVGVLGATALSKGVEAVGSAVSTFVRENEKSGEKTGEMGDVAPDRDLWNRFAQTAGNTLDDVKPSMQSLTKNVNEWSRNLGNAAEWAGEEIGKDVDGTVHNLQEWTKEQGALISGSLMELGQGLKVSRKTTTPAMPAASTSVTDGSSFNDVMGALRTYRKQRAESARDKKQQKAAAKLTADPVPAASTSPVLSAAATVVKEFEAKAHSKGNKEMEKVEERTGKEATGKSGFSSPFAKKESVAEAKAMEEKEQASGVVETSKLNEATERERTGKIGFSLPFTRKEPVSELKAKDKEERGTAVLRTTKDSGENVVKEAAKEGTSGKLGFPLPFSRKEPVSELKVKEETAQPAAGWETSKLEGSVVQEMKEVKDVKEAVSTAPISRALEGGEKPTTLSVEDRENEPEPPKPAPAVSKPAPKKLEPTIGPTAGKATQAGEEPKKMEQMVKQSVGFPQPAAAKTVPAPASLPLPLPPPYFRRTIKRDPPPPAVNSPPLAGSMPAPPAKMVPSAAKVLSPDVKTPPPAANMPPAQPTSHLVAAPSPAANPSPAPTKPSFPASKQQVSMQDKKISGMVQRMIEGNQKSPVTTSKPAVEKEVPKPSVVAGRVSVTPGPMIAAEKEDQPSPPPPPPPSTPPAPAAPTPTAAAESQVPASSDGTASSPHPSPEPKAGAKQPAKEEVKGKNDDREATGKSRVTLSTSSSEKSGPGTAAFFKTGGSSVKGGSLGGAAGVSILVNDSGEASKESGSSSGSAPPRGFLGEELGIRRKPAPSPVNPPKSGASDAKPDEVESIDGGDIGSRGGDDDTGGSGGSGRSGGAGGAGGAGGSTGDNGGKSPDSPPFLWLFVLIAIGAFAYKTYKDRQAGGSSDEVEMFSTAGPKK